MSREEIQKLLGGYATGTLTAEEQQALFAAALEDQELFDALGREQSLRDLLRDPAARAHLLAALDEPAPAPWFRRWWMPLSAATVAVALASVTIVAVRRHSPAAPEVTVAKLEQAVAAPAAAAPAPAPAAAPAELKTAVGNQPAVAMVKKSPPVTAARVAAPPAPPPPWPRVELQAVPPAALPPSTKDTAAPKVGAATDGAEMVISYATSAGLEKALAETTAQSHGAVSGFPETATALFYGGASGGTSGGGGRGGAGAIGGVISGAPSAARPMAKAAAAPAGHLGIQYRILLKTPAGDFVEADAAATGSVAAGAPFKLQITANDSGYVRVLQEAPDGAWREIVNHAVERMQPIETEPIQLDQPGRVKLYLMFSRQPLPPSNVPQPDDDILVDRGRVVTVAGRAAAAQRLSFNITLTIQ
jgi:hypothetical protein